MNNIYILITNIIFVFSLFLPKANAQIWQGNILLETQAQVDSFRLKYGAIQVIEGSLVIRGADTAHLSDIYSLDSLKSVQLVVNNFGVLYTKFLRNLKGLEQMNLVGGYTGFFFNQGLQNLEGLQHLTSTGSSLYVYDNDSLTTLAGLRNVRDLGLDPEFSQFHVLRNPLLRTVGMTSLQRVGQVLMEENNGLENLDGLDSLQTGTYMYLRFLPHLKSVSGLKRLRFAERLEFRDCDALPNFNGFASLVPNKAKFDIFKIRSCDALVNLKGLEKLDSITTFPIVNNANLENLDGLDGLTNQGWQTLGGYVYSLDTFAYEYVSDIAIIDNPKLTSIAIPTLKKVSTLIVDRNNLLTNLDGLESLELGSVGATLNPNLQSIEGIYNLQKTNHLVFDRNKIDTISGFNNLTEFIEIKILNDTALRVFEGLSSIDSCRGDINISGSPFFESDKLQKVDILKNAKHVGLFKYLLYDYTPEMNEYPISLDIAPIAITAKGIVLSLNFKRVSARVFPMCIHGFFESPYPMNFDSIGGGGFYLKMIGEDSDFYNSFSNSKRLAYLSVTKSKYFPSQITNLQLIRTLDITGCTFSNIPPLFGSQIKKILSRTDTPYSSASLSIAGNTNLKAFNLFPNITSFRGKIELFDNDSLTDCSTLCRILTLPPANYLTDIHDNPYPCDTKTHILAWCDTINPVSNIPFEPLQFTLSPNPTTSGTLIEADGSESGIRFVAIVNSQGQKVQEQFFPEGLQKSYFLSTDDFTAGLYQVVVQTERHQGVRNLVIVR
jgi:hypothetical protein